LLYKPGHDYYSEKKGFATAMSRKAALIEPESSINDE
jgi:hypothetical protein